jgi:hypothetical protein
MGIIQHDAMIIVYGSAWNEKGRAKESKALAIIRGIAAEYTDEWMSLDTLLLGPVAHSNGYATLFVAPDGSKEGWEVSEKGNEMRMRIRDAAMKHLHDPEVINVTWGEVRALTATATYKEPTLIDMRDGFPTNEIFSD